MSHPDPNLPSPMHHQAGQPPARKRSKGPKVMVISGAIGLLLGAIAVAVGLSTFATNAEHEVLESGIRHDLTLDTDTTYDIFVRGSLSITCTAQDSTGADLSVRHPSSNLHINGRERLLTLTTGSNDPVAILHCETNDGTPYYLGQGGTAAVVTMTLSIIVSVGLFLLSIGFIIGGVIWRFAEAKRRTQTGGFTPEA